MSWPCRSGIACRPGRYPSGKHARPRHCIRQLRKLKQEFRGARFEYRFLRDVHSHKFSAEKDRTTLYRPVASVAGYPHREKPESCFLHPEAWGMAEHILRPYRTRPKHRRSSGCRGENCPWPSLNYIPANGIGSPEDLGLPSTAEPINRYSSFRTAGYTTGNGRRVTNGSKITSCVGPTNTCSFPEPFASF